MAGGSRIGGTSSSSLKRGRGKLKGTGKDNIDPVLEAVSGYDFRC